MHNVKIFTDADPQKVEQAFDTWMRERGDDLLLGQTLVSTTATEHGHYVTIFQFYDRTHRHKEL